MKKKLYTTVFVMYIICIFILSGCQNNENLRLLTKDLNQIENVKLKDNGYETTLDSNTSIQIYNILQNTKVALDDYDQ